MSQITEAVKAWRARAADKQAKAARGRPAVLLGRELRKALTWDAFRNRGSMAHESTMSRLRARGYLLTAKLDRNWRRENAAKQA